jgi:hypothetical protein
MKLGASSADPANQSDQDGGVSRPLESRARIVPVGAGILKLVHHFRQTILRMESKQAGGLKTATDVFDFTIRLAQHRDLLPVMWHIT